MVFNSLIFIFLFLPISVLLYQIVPGIKIKKFVLLLMSLLFYCWANPISLVLLLISILWNYFTGLEIQLYEGTKRKIVFIIGILFNILILGIYKYANFFLGFTGLHFDLSLPVGLSFFTFSAISYIADVYMNKVNPQKSLLMVALYISFFGKVSMGPIVQYHDMEEQLQSFMRLNVVTFGAGMKKFIKGLVKKAILADQFSMLFAALNGNETVLGTWLFAIAYMLQIYFDFSGYSDMAIGLSSMFGFEFAENFDHPYIATSVQDFWRRWHISLSRWFRDYIYIPLGGNRVSNVLYIRNIMIVWLCTGLWHGANWTFIVWGIYYGILLLLEKFVLNDILKKMPTFVRHLYTLILVLIGWVFFMSNSLPEALNILSRMLGIYATGLANFETFFSLKQFLFFLVFGCLFCMPIQEKIETFISKKLAVSMNLIVYVLFFVIAIAFVVSSTFQSFLYFAF
ncbi:MAG: MBOAT family O-acyltransferase [Bacillota bacterium]|nr:MBOAT family O-acyltransferase [Bacillota bacterium]